MPSNTVINFSSLSSSSFFWGGLASKLSKHRKNVSDLNIDCLVFILYNLTNKQKIYCCEHEQKKNEQKKTQSCADGSSLQSGELKIDWRAGGLVYIKR